MTGHLTQRHPKGMERLLNIQFKDILILTIIEFLGYKRTHKRLYQFVSQKMHKGYLKFTGIDNKI